MQASIQEVTSKIIEIEKRNDLFSWHIDDIYIWEIIRYKVYMMALNNALERSQSQKKNIVTKVKSFYKKVVFNLRKYFNAIIHQPYTDSVAVDVMIIESSRKLLFEGEYIDPYTKFTYDKLLCEGKSITKYQSSFTFDCLAKNGSDIKHFDLPYIIAGIGARLRTITINKEDEQKIKELKEEIETELDLVIDLHHLISEEIKIFKLKNRFFTKLLNKKKPKEIYLVNFCDKPALIASAKKQKIKVIDIQHGLISSGDLIYNYPNTNDGTLNYFPDQFYAWSEVWSNICKIPLKKENIINYGNPYLTIISSKYKNSIVKKKQSIIISQPGITELILDLLIKNINSFKGYEILFKFHPNEYSYGFGLEQTKLLQSKYKVVFLDEKIDLYQKLAESVNAYGAGSTTLIEALEFNCKVFVFNLPSSEWMIPFIDDKKISWFNENALKN